MNLLIYQITESISIEIKESARAVKNGKAPDVDEDGSKTGVTSRVNSV